MRTRSAITAADSHTPGLRIRIAGCELGSESCFPLVNQRRGEGGAISRRFCSQIRQRAASSSGVSLRRYRRVPMNSPRRETAQVGDRDVTREKLLRARPYGTHRATPRCGGRIASAPRARRAPTMQIGAHECKPLPRRRAPHCSSCNRFCAKTGHMRLLKPRHQREGAHGQGERHVHLPTERDRLAGRGT